jgi:transcriptional regulator with XRE-family HTH domain
MSKKTKPPDPVAAMIAQIRDRMDAEGISQSELARRSGIQQPRISDALNGKDEPGSRKIAKMAAAVGGEWRLVEKTKRPVV